MNCQSRAVAAAPLPLRDFLDEVDPRKLDLNNRLLRPRQPMRVELNGVESALTWIATSQAPTDAWHIDLALGDVRGSLLLPRSLCARLLRTLELTPDTLESLVPAAQSILLEQASLAWVERLERVLEQPVQLSVSSRVRELPVSLALNMAWADGETDLVHIALDEQAASHVLDILDRHAPVVRQPLPTLRLPLQLQAGWQWLSLNELRSLRTGDVLMLDVPHQADLLLSLQGGRQARGQREERGVRLLETMNPVDPMMEYPMSQGIEDDGLEASLGDVQLKVVCQVGSLDMSLTELRELGEGSVLQLPQGDGDVVELVVNGRSIGRGELVKIGDGLGVRVTRFAAP